MMYGTIVFWNDSRGFGFIKPDNENQMIFVHISAFGRLLNRPVIGDRVHFDAIIEQTGKQKAKIARIIETDIQVNDTNKPQSVKKLYTKPVWVSTQHYSGRKNKGALFLLGFLVIAGLLAKSNLFSGSAPHVVDKREYAPETKKAERFKCEGKVHCSQMSSYEEALFYLNNCPGTQMDGDNDGIPCEQQFSR